MADSLEWIEKLSELRRLRKPCAVVVVTGVRGSGPRDAGARMVVADGRLAWGTIGGGSLEKLAIEHATALLGGASAASETRHYPLGETAGQCCGGRVTLFFETFPWRRSTVAVFGAGHVAQALGGLAPWIQADLLLIDGRDEDEIQPPPPRERPWALCTVDAPEAEIDLLPESALVVVMTHSHALDLAIVEAALRRGTFPYLGLIGSERKWSRFRARLARKGFREEELARVRCPIGVSRASKDPSAIALSTAVELVEVLAAVVGAGLTRRAP
jgi:xanthine dehydrogenase accessory factor